MAASGHLSHAGRSALLLTLVTFAVAALTLLVSRRLFRRTWLRALPVTSRIRSKSTSFAKGWSGNLSPALAVALMDLRFATRNRDMWPGALGALAIYLGPVLVLVTGGYLPGQEAEIMSLLVMGASVFSVTAASVPFYTMELMANRDLIVGRFWLLKLLPIRDVDVFTGRFLAHMALAVPLGLLGLTVFTLARPVTIPMFAASIMATSLFTAAMIALHLAWEALFIHRFRGVLSPFANILSLGLDAALIILGRGLLAAYAWRDLVSRVPILGVVPEALGLPGTLAISGAIGIAFLWLSFRVIVAAHGDLTDSGPEQDISR